MNRIRIEDLPVEQELTDVEQQDICGGWSWGMNQTSLATRTGSSPTVDPSDPSAGTQTGIIAILIGL